MGLVGNGVEMDQAIVEKGFKIEIISEERSGDDGVNGYVGEGQCVEEGKVLGEKDGKKYVEV